MAGLAVDLRNLRGFDREDQKEPAGGWDSLPAVDPSLLASTNSLFRVGTEDAVKTVVLNEEVEAFRERNTFRTAALRHAASQLPGVQRLLSVSLQYEGWIVGTRERSRDVPDGTLIEWAARFLPLLRTMQALHKVGVVLGDIDEHALVFVGQGADAHLAFGLNLFRLEPTWDAWASTTNTMETNVEQMRQEMLRRVGYGDIPAPPELESREAVALKQLIYAMEHITDWVALWERCGRDFWDAREQWLALLAPRTSPDQAPLDPVIPLKLRVKLRSSGVETVGDLLAVAHHPDVFHFLCTAEQVDRRGASVTVTARADVISPEEAEKTRALLLVWKAANAGTIDPTRRLF